MSIEYIEFAKDMEYCEVRAPDIRVPPSIDDELGAFHTRFFV